VLRRKAGNILNYKDSNLSALIGLIGASTNNGKTEDTDQIISEALVSERTNEMTLKLHREKFRISPDCATCASPCGNTSDFDMTRFDDEPEDIIEVKSRVYLALQDVANNYLKKKASGISISLPASVEKAITYLSYDLSKETFEDLIKELGN